jgi:hypothetical protein
MYDLGKTQKDYALFLPAISSFYVKQLEKIAKDGGRVPEGFELGHEGMDFLSLSMGVIFSRSCSVRSN